MNYYSKNKENFYQKLTDDPLFSSLTDYLYEHREQETILRELKKEFSQNKFSHFLFITLSSIEHFPLTLANYFFVQKNQLPVTKAFKELAELIGDVNESYFFDQIEVIVDRIRKNKYKNRRPSIFHQSLLVTNTIKEEESFTLELPIVEKNNFEIELPTLDPSLTMEEMAFLKRQIFSELSKKFIPHAFSYIKEYGTVLVSKT
ncbi:DUF1803 domain-containing protein [Enterococcus faecium]|uniref:DUF1803 domain-containing protein n=1 Tax=Enterococcus faecium TaxID=1352 RepID=UPI0020734A69|nr:DUF1803 domain-containing protein [Enterococcus faecium]MCM6922452.1 DUF1803 domain-containing protein [Enterococcus faecium]